MAKQVNKRPVTATPPKQEPVAQNNPWLPDLRFPEWLSEFKVQALIVAALAFIFYINTYKNEAAHDDTMVIVQNEYVLEGLSGIPDIFTKDAYDSYYKQFNSGNQLSGGRYRPLSIVTFAIEQQIFGAVKKDKIDSFLNHPMVMGQKDPGTIKLEQNMHIRHVINVLWYMLAAVVLLYFMRYIIFRSNPIMALLAVVIFTIHPIHTEVVANVKSRDEIMSIVFMSLTFIFAFKYQEHKKMEMLIAALLSYFLAFLSKEYAITIMALLPLSFYLFNRYTIGKSITATLPFGAVVAVYLLMRLPVVGEPNPDSGSEILNNPYHFAVGSEKIATEIATTLNYLKLLIVPYPLSADYSYNTIPYKDITNPLVWLSLVVHGGMIYFFFKFFSKSGKGDVKTQEPGTATWEYARPILCFAIAFYMSHLLMICNIVFDIGATMGERLIFHSSVGFSIAVAFFLYKGLELIQSKTVGNTILAVFMLGLTVCWGYITIERNGDWKNDYTLFTHDLNVVPNSVLVNANVAAALIDKSEFEKDQKTKEADIYRGIELLNKALALHPTYVSSYLNKGLAYFKLKVPDSVVANLEVVRKMYPNHPKLPEMYYNAGVMFYLNKDNAKAAAAWQNVLKIKPDYANAANALNVLKSQQH